MADYEKTKKMLQELLDKKKADKEQEEGHRRMRNEEDRNAMLSTISKDLTASLKPVLAEMAKGSRISSDELRAAIQDQLNIAIPEIKMPEFPEIKIPDIKVPKADVKVNFDTSKIKFPEIKMPDRMMVEGMVALAGIDLAHPLPVHIRTQDGKPIDLEKVFSNIGAGNGGFRHVIVDKMPTITVSALSDTELRAAHLDVQQLSGSIDSVFVTGFADSSVVFEVMTTNKTAKSDGADIRPKADDLGRVVTRPIQVRDLTATAFATLTDSSEDTLFTGVASTFHDLIYVVAANESGAAVNVAIRCGTGGSKAASLSIPANGTVGFVLPVPYPASEVAQTWTAQNTGSDISNTTVNITAGFSKEV